MKLMHSRFSALNVKNDVDVGSMQSNQESYILISRQVKTAFRLTFVFCLVGLLLLVCMFLLPLLGIQYSYISGLCGAVAELFVGTSFALYRRLLKELKHYQKVLHDDERLMAIADLSCKFSTIELQDEMLKELIKSAIHSGSADNKL